MSHNAQDTFATIVADLERAWNAGDGTAFARPFTDDADFVNVRGEHQRGRDAIARGHQAIFDSIYKGSVVSYTAAVAKVMEPATIIGHVRSVLKAPSGPLAGEHSALATLVLVANGDVWRIAAFHNTLVVAAR